MDRVLLHADLGELIQGLIVLLFFAGPAIARSLGKRDEQRPQPPRRRPAPTQGAGGSGGGTVTWKDLLEGRVEALPDAPPAEAELEEVTIEVTEPSPESGPERGPERSVEPQPRRLAGARGATEETDSAWGQDPFAFESSDLVPDSRLAPVPSEDEIERRLPDYADHQLAAAERAAFALDSSRDQQDPLGLVGAGPAEMRRAIVIAEVLGPPVALRHGSAFTGPPSAST